MRYHTKITLEINENQRKFTNQRITKNKQKIYGHSLPGAEKAAHPLPPSLAGCAYFCLRLRGLHYNNSVNVLYFTLLY